MSDQTEKGKRAASHASRPSPWAGWVFAVVALAMGGWFFASLERLWPLPGVDLHRPREDLVAQASAFIKQREFDLEGFQAASRLRVDEPALDFLESVMPLERVRERIAARVGLVRYQVFFKKRGEPRMYSVALHPDGSVLAWGSTWLEEAPGASLSEVEAREMAESEVAEALALDLSTWRAQGVQSSDLPQRRRFGFTYEREWQEAAGLRERLFVTIEGDVAAGAIRRLVVPESARLKARADRAPREALQYLGWSLLGLAGFAAIVVFFNQLRAGAVRLWPAVRLAGIAFACGLATQALQTADLFLDWEPLWPRWVSTFRSMFFHAAQNGMIFLLLLVLIAAGDALDREFGKGRGKGLWLLANGGFFNPDVARQCAQGFLVGLICGGAMALLVPLVEFFGGGAVSIQPRGFFFYAFNASHPGLATLLFFLGIAMMEELGYRFFGGTWLERVCGRRWLAILVPALIYGLTHTDLSFLPPASPFWGRALVMTAVGCVWGWGFFRFGALAVVISHFTADLFIFNWPWLASEDWGIRVQAALTIGAPLLPVLTYAAYRLFRGLSRVSDSS